MGIYDAPSRYDLVREAMLCYDGLSGFRQRRARSRNYFRNLPDETMTHPDTGITVKEDDFIREQGRNPIHLSRIGKILQNLLGQYRSMKMQRMAYGRNREDNEAADQMTEALRAANDVNETDELDVREFLEMLLSGLFGWKNTYTWMPRLNRRDVYIQNIDATRFYYNPDIVDPRTHDLRICGQIHDVLIDDVIAWFAKDPSDEKRIRDICKDSSQYANAEAPYTPGFASRDNLSFLVPSDPNKIRLIEHWRIEFGWVNFLHDKVTASCEVSDMTPEQVNQLNAMRQQEAINNGMAPPPPIEQFPKYEPVWKVYFLTPMGHVLFEGQTPYWHECDPYTIGFAEFLDGEVWGAVEEMIEPQRQINRLNSIIDYAIGASAKGVLLVPEDCIPENMNLNEFAAEWTKFNGVIKIKLKPGMQPPKQIVQNSIPDGIFTLLENMYQDLRESSGVQEANMGTAPVAGTPASSYVAQIQQGQTTTRNYIDSFFAVRKRRDLRTVQLIAQFYDTPMQVPVMGKRADGSKYITYDPSRVRQIEWDLIISETPDTPANRQQMEEYLLNFLNANRITFGQYLQMSSHPKADLIMNIIQKTNPLLAEQKMGMQDIAQLQAQLQMQAQSGNADAMALLNQAN